MVQSLTIKDMVREGRIFSHRIFIAIVVMTLSFVLLAINLYDIQIQQYDHFTTRSHSNRVKVLPVAPPRGLILSRKGEILAENKSSFALEVIPEQVEDIDQLIVQINSLIGLSGSEIERFKRIIKRKRRFEKIPLKVNLTEEEVARFSVNRHRFPGVDISSRLIRHYPQGKTFSHVLGYVGRINEKEQKMIDPANYSASTHYGKTGVEKTYEHLLHGKVGYQQVEVNAQGRILRVLKRTAPVPGENLYLTLDAGLQTEAMKALGDYRGAVVALEPTTGAVLALVSNPGYDPNWFVNGISAQQYKELRESPDRPLFNRALQGQYPPGSTIKPFVGLIAKQQGLRDTHDHSWCPGWFSLPEGTHRYRCWNKHGHGRIGLSNAIVQSCDVYFYELAHDMGIDQMHQYMSEFGFGQRTGIDLPGEAKGIMPSKAWKRKVHDVSWYPGETIITGIGQGYMLTTPLQLATATATIGRKGPHALPKIVGQIENVITKTSGDRLSSSAIKVVEADKENWLEIIQAMRDVVHSPTGTARRSGEGAAYEFAGKTGTAQVFGIKQDEEEKLAPEEITERLRDHALFIAFAPVENPVIALAIIVENGGSGSKTAAPIARKLLDYYMSLQHRG